MDREFLLTDASTKLHNARNLTTNVPYELHDFADYLANVVDDYEVSPMGMITLIACALDDLRKEYCGFANKVPFPEKLKNERFQVIDYLTYFPIIIDKIASKEFAEEFRRIFIMVFGKAQPPVNETKNIILE